MTQFSDLGLVFLWRDSLTRATGVKQYPLPEISSYEHTSSAFGGYDTASVSASAKQVEIEDWLENGLGRDVEVWDESLTLRWKGFVNEVEGKIGPSTTRIGPLLETVNRCWGRYTPLDTTTNPPVTGTETALAAAENTDAQTKYGVIEQVFSLGTCPDYVAEQARDTFLAERAWPEASDDLGEPAEPSVTISCLGYFHWLDVVMYEDVTNVGTRAISSQTAPYGLLQNVLAAAAAINSWCVQTDYANTDDNAALEPRAENTDPTCLGVIKSLVAVGDASYNRWTFGLYDDRMPHYHAVPTTFDYQADVASVGLDVRMWQGNAPLRPWAVLPARWLFKRNFLPGRGGVVVPDRRDPRCVFIETVRYSAPYSLSLGGGRVGRLDQLLASEGLGGASS